VSGAVSVEPAAELGPAGVPSRHGAWSVSARTAGLAVSGSVRTRKRAAVPASVIAPRSERVEGADRSASVLTELCDGVSQEILRSLNPFLWRNHFVEGFGFRLSGEKVQVTSKK
jgi:hypothetical protein